MKQLLIVKKSAAYNAKLDGGGSSATPFDLSNLGEGALVMFELDATSVLAAGTPPAKSFAMALGRPNNSPAFLIPEVDIDSLTVTKALPTQGAKYHGEITIPSPSAGKTYTLMLVKKGTVPHERNTWTATETLPTGSSMTAAQLATKLGNYFKEFANSGSFNITVTITSAKIEIDGTVNGEDFVLKAADDLAGTSVTNNAAKKAIGDKAYIQDLASQCAAGKGYNYVDGDGKDIYPGYPEPVEDLTPNSATPGSSTEGYAIFTLRFAVPRASAKTRDEVVNQVVHVAVPVSNSSYSNIAAMFEGASKFLTKAVADDLYEPATP